MIEDTKISDEEVKSKALNYVNSLKNGQSHYRMTSNLDGTIFTDCFAFFTRHLLADSFCNEELTSFIDFLLEKQDPLTGLWHSPISEQALVQAHDHEHTSRQLTTFVLTILDQSGVKPLHSLHFVHRYIPKGATHDYLTNLNWSRNPWNACNRAMFIAIFLIHCMTNERIEGALEALDEWFDWHEQYARPSSGFWGHGFHADWYIGFGGAAHQYIIYDYMQRTPPHLERAIDQVLKMQYDDGRFWPLHGSGSCYEMDAVQILYTGFKRTDYRRDDIKRSLTKLIDMILSCQNPDGGFCWAPRRWFHWEDIARSLMITQNPRIILWSAKMQAIAHVKRNNLRTPTVWTNGRHTIQESSLFDTWFRLLTLAQIAQTITDSRISEIPWQPLSFPNWGYFSLG